VFLASRKLPRECSTVVGLVPVGIGVVLFYHT
jgi:hypothetical protein